MIVLEGNIVIIGQHIRSMYEVDVYKLFSSAGAGVLVLPENDFMGPEAL
jgi:hypothetical protein